MFDAITSRPRTLRAERVEQFEGGQAGPRQVVRLDSPDRAPWRRDARDCRACDSREAGRSSGRARGRPGRCPARSGSHSRRTALPALPSASSQIDEREHIVDAVALLLGAARRSAPWRSPLRPSCARRARCCAAGTPVMRSTRSGQNEDATIAAHRARNPFVRVCDEAARRSACRWIATWSSPLASAASVPGVSCRCRWATAAVAVRRGSATISLPPRRRCASKYCMTGGMVVGGVAADQQDRLGAGNILQRERQAAIDPECAQAGRGGRRPCRSGRCSRCSRSAARRGRICRAVGLLVGETAAAEDGDASGPCAAWIRAEACRDDAERLVQAGRPEFAVGRIAHQGRGQPVGRVEQVRGGPALAAQAAFVGREVAGRHLHSTPSRTRDIPHCSAQYGQWVSVTSTWIAASIRAKGSLTPPNKPYAMFGCYLAI